MTDIHSCSYFCTRPACVLAQRDELRDKMLVQTELVDKWLTDDLPQVDKEQAEPVAELDAISRALGGDAYWMDPPDGGSVTLADQVARANKAGRAFAQQQAEPVAWTTMPDADDWTFISGAQDPNGKLEGKWYALYSSPQQQAEPVKQAEPVVEPKGGK
jgi:hypothetical protein